MLEKKAKIRLQQFGLVEHTRMRFRSLVYSHYTLNFETVYDFLRKEIPEPDGIAEGVVKDSSQDNDLKGPNQDGEVKGTHQNGGVKGETQVGGPRP